MKTSDYITVGFIAIFVTLLSYFLVNSILGDPSEKSITFDYIADYSKELATPDPELFNIAAINPTVEVYIGSCEDTNQDGELSDEERHNCGLDRYDSDVDLVRADFLEENSGLSNEENDEINARNAYARGTSAQQRQAVEDSVNQYQQEQIEQQQSTHDAARQETVSGS